MVFTESVGDNEVDATFILNKSVALNTKKMSEALKGQDVIATCRYLLYKTYLDWHDAKDSCQNIPLPMTKKKRSSMATVKTKAENKDLLTLMKLAYETEDLKKKKDPRNWLWLGLEKVINNNVKLSRKQRGAKNFKSSEWRWVDGSEPVWWKWPKKKPDQKKHRKKNKFQDKVSLSKKGKWGDNFSFKKMPYACNYCGKYIVIKKHVKWEQARKMCKSFGLTMAKINNKKENNEFDKAAKIMMGEEVEERRWNNTNWIWIGTREVMDENGIGTGVWEHHDGTPLLWDKPPWGFKRQPDNWVRKKKGEQQAVAFSRINKKWDDSFPSKERPFACMCPGDACSWTSK